MYGNSFFKIIVIMFSVITVFLSIYTVVLNKSPLVVFIVFVITIILNIIDRFITKIEYEKNMKTVYNQMQELKKDIKKK